MKRTIQISLQNQSAEETHTTAVRIANDLFLKSMEALKSMNLGANTGLQSKKKYEQESQNDHPGPMDGNLNPVRMVRMSETFSIRIEGSK